MIHALRAQDPLLLGQEEVDLPRRDLRKRKSPKLRLDDVLPDRRDGAFVRGRVAQERGNPPLDQLGDRSAAVFEVSGFEAQALPLEPPLEIVCEAPRLCLGRCTRRKSKLPNASFPRTRPK